MSPNTYHPAGTAMDDENEQSKDIRPRRGAVDYSAILGEDRRKRFNMVNRLRMRLIELDVRGDSIRDADILDEVRQVIREILREFVLEQLDKQKRGEGHWHEELASAGESNIKADKEKVEDHDEHIEDLQKQTEQAANKGKM
ncbi:hypothetical protein FKW77_005729 [Venturia effusa]|uniref:Uncharacterized protein n=1 Tax=Venturia effusa TaxID=50376 RepID=A0A517L9C9_9PEZI|nr:hypothetical protein FKW77_005729 [Venturia effusa]